MKINPPSSKALAKANELSDKECAVLLKRGMLRFGKHEGYLSLSHSEQVALQLEYEADAINSWNKALQALRKKDKKKNK